MTSPSEKDERIYTEIFNPLFLIKEREVKCTHCNYTVITDLPVPKCRNCRDYLITVINPVIEKDELA